MFSFASTQSCMPSEHGVRVQAFGFKRSRSLISSQSRNGFAGLSAINRSWKAHAP